tara:strand:+ start:1535 stop:1747 length:213 start_codon:yes stop_codon:yes gene_type:complete
MDPSPKQKFQGELLALFSRWGNESDLDVLEMAEASVEIINKVCNTPAIEMESDIEFEPDTDFTDKLNEED